MDEVKTPIITIDKVAIRFEYREGGINLFFDDLFRFGAKGDWHRELLDAIKHCYDECVRLNVEVPKDIPE